MCPALSSAPRPWRVLELSTLESPERVPEALELLEPEFPELLLPFEPPLELLPELPLELLPELPPLELEPSRAIAGVCSFQAALHRTIVRFP